MEEMATEGRCPQKLCWRDNSGRDQGRRHTRPGLSAGSQLLLLPFRPFPHLTSKDTEARGGEGAAESTQDSAPARNGCKGQHVLQHRAGPPVSREPPGSGPGTPRAHSSCKTADPAGLSGHQSPQLSWPQGPGRAGLQGPNQNLHPGCFWLLPRLPAPATSCLGHQHPPASPLWVW